MCRWLHSLLFVLATGASFEARSELAFEAEVSLHPDSALPQHGNTTTWVLSWTNIGDEPIVSAALSTEYFEQGTGRTLILNGTSSTAPCTVAYTDLSIPSTQQVLVFAQVFASPMPVAPGATVSCTVDLVVDPVAPNFFTQLFGFIVFDLENDSAVQFVETPFQLGPLTEPIPSLSSLSVVLLGAALLVVGILAPGQVSRRRAR
jgi:hypothetical protein